MRLLVINSNTSTAVTERVALAARKFASAETELVFATGNFGAAVIATRTEDAIAAHSTVDLMAKHAPSCDGVLIAVSYDSGLRAARELTGQPVLAITEASILVALTLGTRVGLVVWGRGAPSLYQEIVESYGFGSRICGWRRVDHPVPDQPSEEHSLDQALLAASTELIEQNDAEVIVLMGAVLAGRSSHLEQSLPVPVLDGVRCGMPMLEAMVKVAPRPPLRGSYAFPGGRANVGLSSDLGDRLARTR